MTSASDDAADRIRLASGREVMLVPWHAVQRDVDIEGARALLISAFEDPENASSLRRFAAQSPGEDLDDAAIVEHLALLLASGGLLFVHGQHARGLPSGVGESAADEPGVTPLLSDLLPTDRRPDRTVTWIEILCVGLAGAAYAGARVRLTLPSSEVVEARLDASSTLRLETLKSPGTCRFEVPADSARSGTLRLEERPQITGQEPRIRCGGTPLSLATGVRHVVIVEARHVFSC